MGRLLAAAVSALALLPSLANATGLTIYQYGSYEPGIGPSGTPTVTRNVPIGTPLVLATSTQYVEVQSDSAVRLRIARGAQTADATDRYLPASTILGRYIGSAETIYQPYSIASTLDITSASAAPLPDTAPGDIASIRASETATASSTGQMATSITTLFKSGQSIGNTGFNALQSGAAVTITNPLFAGLSQGGVAVGPANPLYVQGNFTISGGTTNAVDQTSDGSSNNVQISPTTLTNILDSSAATTNAVLVSSIARTLKYVSYTQTSTNPDCLTFYNTSTTPTAGSNSGTRTLSVNIPGTPGNYSHSWPSGIYHSAGVGYTLTRGNCSATNSAAIAVGEILSLNTMVR